MAAGFTVGIRVLARVVVVGSGFAGVEAVRVLGRLAGCGVENECVLVTPRPVLSFVPYAPAVAGGRFERGDVEWGVERFAERNGFTVVAKKTVAVTGESVRLEDGEEIGFDYALIAAGARPAFYGVPGADSEAIPLYSIEDGLRLREAAGKAEKIVIVGAGFVGVEAAAELLEAAKRDGRKLSVVLVDLLPEPLGLLRNPEASRLVRRILENLGAEFVLGKKVVKVENNCVVLEDGSHVDGDAVVWSAGFQGPGIELPRDSLGRGMFILVDEYLRVKGLGGRVFAAGDAAAIRSGDCAALKMAREAVRSAATAALNIATLLRGGKSLERYRPLLSTCAPQAGLVLGPRRGVMLLGYRLAFESRIPHLYHERIRREYMEMLAA